VGPTTNDGPGDLVNGLLFLAPGFLALKIFYLFGAQRARSDWEWTAWSVIASIPIVGVAAYLRSLVGPPEIAAPDPLEVLFRVAVAVAVGGSLVGVWWLIYRAPFPWATALVERVQDSVWDHVIAKEISAGRRVAEIVLADGTRYQGTIRHAGREDAGAREFVYLIHPEIFDEATGRFRDALGTRGILVHREEIRRIRVRMSNKEYDEVTNAAMDPMSGT
jgi:hypothetical protein